MDELKTSAEVVESTQDVAPSEESAKSEEQSRTSLEDKVEMTQAFSNRLKTASARKVDEFVASMGLTNPYDNDKPITTRKEYDAFKSMQKLDEEGNPDPVSSYRATSVDIENQNLRDQLRDIELQSDPQKGEVYKKYRDEVMELVEYCRNNGQKVDIDSALNTILSNKYWDERESIQKQAQDESLKKIKSNSIASPGALSGESPNDTADFKTMSDADFDKFYEKAIRGGMRKS